jgi:hypothetical protein
MSKLLIILSLILVNEAFGQKKKPKYDDISTMLLQEQPYSYDEFIQHIQGKKITNLEEFVSSLPEAMKKNYVLVYESKSLQSADYQKPRVIMRSPLSEVMITFTDPGERNNKHDQNIELMFWDKKEKAFKMKEITFGQGTYQISETNPSKCISCHGADPRPNWEPYSTWPGVYGGDADFFVGNELVKGERKNLEKFIKKNSNHPLYKNLHDLKANFKIGISPKGQKEAIGLSNYKFTESLTKLNFQRIVAQMKSNPEYEYFKYASLYIAAPFCSDSRAFPESLTKSNNFIKADPDWGVDNLIDLYDWLGSNTSKWSMSFQGVEKSLRLQSPDGDSQNMVYALMEADPSLRSFFKKQDPLNWEKNKFYEYGEKEIDCELLRKKSIEVLNSAPLSHLCQEKMKTEVDNLALSVTTILSEDDLESSRRGKSIIESICMRCHRSNTSLDFFKNEKTLINTIEENDEFINHVAQRLKSVEYPMPPKPHSQLNESQQQDLLNYLNDLKKRNSTPIEKSNKGSSE